MNGYIAFFNNNKIEIHANSQYEAQLKAIEQFKPSKKNKHLVVVVLAEVGGNQINHVGG